MDIISLALSLYLAAQIPTILGVTAVVAVGGALALRNGFKNAAEGISQDLENASENRLQAQAVARLGKDTTVPGQFAQMSRLEQSSLISRWLADAATYGRVFNDTELGNLVSCLQISVPDTGRFASAHNTRPLLQFINTYKERIAEADARSITDSALNMLKNAALTDSKTLATASEIPSPYGHLLQPGHLSICRNIIMAALAQPLPANGNHENHIKALDTLFQPRYAHGGEKRTAAMSLEKGGYTQAERDRILERAQELIEPIKTAIEKDPGYIWRTKDRTAADATLALLQRIKTQPENVTAGPRSAPLSPATFASP